MKYSTFWSDAAALLGGAAARVVMRSLASETAPLSSQELNPASLEDASDASVSVCAPVREAGEEDTDAR